MNYTDFVTRLAGHLVVETTDVEFNAMLPAFIDYAEQRMYRELNLMSTSDSDTAGSLAIGSRLFTPAKHFVVVQQVNLDFAGTKNALTPVSRDFLDAVYGSPSNTGKPKYYCMISDQQVAVGPWPDANYTVEMVGTVRPLALSATNTTTFLTLYLPDAFLACAMISGAGWQKNFGAVADDPRAAMTWETQYTTLMQSAAAEEARKRVNDMRVG